MRRQQLRIRDRKELVQGCTASWKLAGRGLGPRSHGAQTRGLSSSFVNTFNTNQGRVGKFFPLLTRMEPILKKRKLRIRFSDLPKVTNLGSRELGFEPSPKAGWLSAGPHT